MQDAKKEIIKDFEFGRTYDEKEVNEMIQKYHDDYCTLRREMICEHLMKREGSVYYLKGNEK